MLAILNEVNIYVFVEYVFLKDKRYHFIQTNFYIKYYINILNENQ